MQLYIYPHKCWYFKCSSINDVSKKKPKKSQFTKNLKNPNFSSKTTKIIYVRRLQNLILHRACKNWTWSLVYFTRTKNYRTWCSIQVIRFKSYGLFFFQIFLGGGWFFCYNLDFSFRFFSNLDYQIFILVLGFLGF